MSQCDSPCLCVNRLPKHSQTRHRDHTEHSDRNSGRNGLDKRIRTNDETTDKPEGKPSQLVGVVVIAVLETVFGLAMLVNIFQRKQEAAIQSSAFELTRTPDRRCGGETFAAIRDYEASIGPQRYGAASAAAARRRRLIRVGLAPSRRKKIRG